MKQIDIQDIHGFHIGNSEDPDKGTGVTVILSEEGATPGVAVRGGAPGTRETDLIRSEEMIEKIHAVQRCAVCGILPGFSHLDAGFRRLCC